MRDQRSRADRNPGRRRVGRGCSHRRDVDRGRVGGRDGDLHDGGGGFGLRAGHGVVRVVGAGAEAYAGSAGDADVEAAAGVVLAAGTGAAGAVVLAVGACAEGDLGPAGDADVEAGGGVVLTVAVGGGGVGVVTTQGKEAVLDLELDFRTQGTIDLAWGLPAGVQTARK